MKKEYMMDEKTFEKYEDKWRKQMEKKEKKLHKPQDKKGYVDRALHKLVSRKLLVWSATTGFFIAGMLTQDYWIAVSMTYIGSEALANIFRIVKGQ